MTVNKTFDDSLVSITDSIPDDFPAGSPGISSEEIVKQMHTFDPSNPAPRLPAILLLDTSGSMQGDPINSLNEGVRQFVRETKEKNNGTVELEIISFNDVVQVELPFQSLDLIDESNLPVLTAAGMTHMGEALALARHEMRARREFYKSQGFGAYRPWIVLMTDGEPNDAWEEAAKKMLETSEKHKYQFFGVGIGGQVNWDILKRIVPEHPGPAPLKPGCFKDFFKWLSDSLKNISSSTPYEQNNNQIANPGNWIDLFGMDR